MVYSSFSRKYIVALRQGAAPLVLVLAALVCSVAAGEPTYTSGRDVMQAVKDQNRIHSNQRYNVVMEIQDSKKRKRTRNFVSWNKYEPDVSFGLVRFYKPASIKNTALLSNSAEGDDSVHQWIYLPAFRTVKKLLASDKNNSFMGSDFSNADMGGRDIDEDTHTLTKEDEKFYYVNSIPKSDQGNYSRLEYRILKSIMVVRNISFYDRDDKLLKTLTNKKVQKHDGMYVVVETLVENPNKQSQTLLTVNEIDTDTVRDRNFYSTKSLRQ